MLRQLNLLVVPTAISIAFFDATYFLIARVFSFSGHDVLLGVVAGAAGGMYVLAAMLFQSARKLPALAICSGSEVRREPASLSHPES